MLITNRLCIGDVVGRQNSVDEIILDMEYYFDAGLFIIKAITNLRDELFIQVNISKFNSSNYLVNVEFLFACAFSRVYVKLDEEAFWKYFRL